MSSPVCLKRCSMASRVSSTSRPLFHARTRAHVHMSALARADPRNDRRSKVPLLSSRLACPSWCITHKHARTHSGRALRSKDHSLHRPSLSPSAPPVSASPRSDFSPFSLPPSLSSLSQSLSLSVCVCARTRRAASSASVRAPHTHARMSRAPHPPAGCGMRARRPADARIGCRAPVRALSCAFPAGASICTTTSSRVCML